MSKGKRIAKNIKRGRGWKQGVYVPDNPNKYIGNPPIIYRSSYELAFFRFCDHNPNVIGWNSEDVIIPYYSPLDGKAHKYYVDNVVLLRESPDKVSRHLIEIKPRKQTSKPVKTGRMKDSTYKQELRTWIVNEAKWKAAQEWCDKKGLQFTILTEKELGL